MSGKGQSSLEALVVLPLLIGLFVFVGGAGYAVFARAWLGYQVDQALFCSAEPGHQDCETKALSAMNRFLPWGRVRFHLNEINQQAEVDWIWRDARFRQAKTLKLDSRLWR